MLSFADKFLSVLLVLGLLMAPLQGLALSGMACCDHVSASHPISDDGHAHMTMAADTEGQPGCEHCQSGKLCSDCTFGGCGIQLLALLPFVPSTASLRALIPQSLATRSTSPSISFPLLRPPIA